MIAVTELALARFKRIHPEKYFDKFIVRAHSNRLYDVHVFVSHGLFDP